MKIMIPLSSCEVRKNAKGNLILTPLPSNYALGRCAEETVQALRGEQGCKMELSPGSKGPCDGVTDCGDPFLICEQMKSSGGTKVKAAPKAERARQIDHARRHQMTATEVHVNGKGVITTYDTETRKVLQVANRPKSAPN